MCRKFGKVHWKLIYACVLTVSNLINSTETWKYIVTLLCTMYIMNETIKYLKLSCINDKLSYALSSISVHKVTLKKVRIVRNVNI